jgi:hypothetical protein
MAAAAAGAGSGAAAYDLHREWFEIAADIAEHKPTDPPVTSIWPQLKGKTAVHFTGLGVMTTTHIDSKTGVRSSKTHVHRMRSRAPYTPALIEFIMEHIDYKTQIRNEKCNSDWHHFMERVGWTSTDFCGLTEHQFTPISEDEEPKSTDLPIVMKLWEPEVQQRPAEAQYKRAASPVHKRSRSRSRSPRRMDEKDTALAKTDTPTTRARFFDALSNKVEVSIDKTNVTEDECKREFTAIADACLAAIKSRDWTALTNYKSTMCSAWMQGYIDSMFESLKCIQKERWIHTHLIQGPIDRLAELSCGKPSRVEIAVWFPVLIRMCAYCATEGIDFAYSPGGQWMYASSRTKSASHNVAWNGGYNSARHRAYRTVTSALYWMERCYRRGLHQSVDEFGEEIPPIERGFCTFRHCGRRIREYKSEEYGDCNNRHLKPEWWITPAPSSTKRKPQYRCWQHGTPKFMEIEAKKFEELKRAKAPAAAAR